MSPPDRPRRTTDGPRRRPATTAEPRVRRGTVRLPNEIAWRVRGGHPWIFRDALGTRAFRANAGEPIDALDLTGAFVARGIYDPFGPVAIRVFTRDSREILDAVTLRRRVEAARAHRQRFLPPELTAFRVLHGEGDGVPGVTVDKFGDYLVAHLYASAIEPLAPALYDALESVWKPKAIYQQLRFKPQTGEGPRAPGELVRGETAPTEVEVREGGLTFAVDVSAPLGTGLFLDLRAGREAVSRLCPGLDVLNLFSYTGAFSMHAARAGARSVTSVDLASKAHARARRNLQLNGLDEKGHEFVVGDAIKVLAKMAERGKRFGLAIVDPPSFSQAKGGTTFSMQKDYGDLVTATLSVMEPGALLCAASNTAKLPLEEFDRMLGEAAYGAGRTLRCIERVGLPPDFPVPAGFPEGHYLKFQIGVVGV